MSFDVTKAREWERKYAALGDTRDYLHAALNHIEWLETEVARLQPKNQCLGAHDTGEILWPGTAHQGVVCRRCKVFLPC